MYQNPRKPFNATSATDITKETAHKIFVHLVSTYCCFQEGRERRTLASRLISRSNRPTFVCGWLVFITARVSGPV